MKPKAITNNHESIKYYKSTLKYAWTTTSENEEKLLSINLGNIGKYN
jgi:hypothetical protein